MIFESILRQKRHQVNRFAKCGYLHAPANLQHGKWAPEPVLKFRRREKPFNIITDRNTTVRRSPPQPTQSSDCAKPALAYSYKRCITKWIASSNIFVQVMFRVCILYRLNPEPSNAASVHVT